MSTEVITVEAEEVPIEKAVERSFLTSLEKHEINKRMLEERRDECLALKLNGQDKEAYTLIRETRLNQKTNRVVIEKICKKGREDATKTQKAWIAVEKDYVNIISEGEDYLKKLEDEYEQEQERIKLEIKRKQEEAFIIRQADLTKMGASYHDGSFVLNDVSYEAILIKESDNDVWETMKAKFNEQYLINEAKRLAEEKKKEEAVAELLRQQQLQQQKQKELEEREAAIKQKEQEEINRQAAIAENERLIKAQAEEKLWRGRLSELKEAGWNGKEAFDKYYDTKIIATYEQMITISDDVWADIRDAHNKFVVERIAMKEQERLREIEEQKRIAAELAVKKEQERVAEAARIAEEKRLQDEAKKAEEALKATDKMKWAAVLKSIEAIQLPDMKHPAYKQKVIDAKKLIAKIIDL